MDPTKTIFPVKKDSTSFSYNTPTTPTGILDINILSTKSISSFLKLKKTFYNFTNILSEKHILY